MSSDLNFTITKPTIIVLAGHSSAAKSTLISHMQRYCDNSLIHISYDSFFLSIGPKYFGEKMDEGFKFESFYKENAETTEKLRTHIHYGDKAFTVMKAMADLALIYYKKGLNVIIDDVIYYKEILQNYSDVLMDTHTFIFKIFCDADALLSRERFRFNRPLGLAICQQEIIEEKKNWSYDAVIDSTEISVDENMLKIVDIINNDEPKAIYKNANLIDSK